MARLYPNRVPMAMLRRGRLCAGGECMTDPAGSRMRSCHGLSCRAWSLGANRGRRAESRYAGSRIVEQSICHGDSVPSNWRRVTDYGEENRRGAVAESTTGDGRGTWGRRCGAIRLPQGTTGDGRGTWDGCWSILWHKHRHRRQQDILFGEVVSRFLCLCVQR